MISGFQCFLAVSCFLSFAIETTSCFFPYASDFQNMFFSLPIFSIMLQAIFQRLVAVVVVVFFYLFIRKGPTFLPGLAFPPETGLMHFTLEQPIFT